MGFPYHELIPVAILFDNPGITREEFLDLLNKTYSFPYQEFKKNDPWNCKEYIKNNHSLCSLDLEGLARILSLGYSEQYKNFQKCIVDKYGLNIRPPFIHFVDEEKQDSFGYKFKVIRHIENILDEPRKVKELSWGKLKVGDIWEECQLGQDRGIVKKIFKEECFYDPKEEDKFSSHGPRYEYEMEIALIEGNYQTELFSSREELYKSWPQFHHDFVYDWSKKRGNFPVLLNEKGFLWLNNKGEYYLDKETFDHISAGFSVNSSFGYNDLILTSEAIKHKAWKVLSYRGLIHLNQFLNDFPDVIPRYEKTIWDGYTSLYAKQKGMTYSDFLRSRLSRFRKLLS